MELFNPRDPIKISYPPSQKCLCIHCLQPYPDTEEYFPLKNRELELLRLLEIDVYQCKSCIQKGVDKSRPPRPIYGDNIVRYKQDMKAGIAIAFISAFFISTIGFLLLILIGSHEWHEAMTIASLVFIAILTTEAVFYLLK